VDRIDPRNTTALEGRACELCGDQATGVDQVGAREMPTCDSCHEIASSPWFNAIVICDCGRRGLFHEFSSFTQPPPHKPILRCATCADVILRGAAH